MVGLCELITAKIKSTFYRAFTMCQAQFSGFKNYSKPLIIVTTSIWMPSNLDAIPHLHFGKVCHGMGRGLLVSRSNAIP